MRTFSRSTMIRGNVTLPRFALADNQAVFGMAKTRLYSTRASALSQNEHRASQPPKNLSRLALPRSTSRISGKLDRS
jgi:hypothetical protein